MATIRSKPAVIAVAVVVVLSLTTGAALMTSQPVAAKPAGSPTITMEQPHAVLPMYVALTASQLSTLPQANYDAVVPGLLDAASVSNISVPTVSYNLTATLTPLYGADRYGAPVATLPRLNFTGQPTVIVPVGTAIGGWTEVLTPSRNAEPSAQGGRAASQTMAWVRSSDLGPATAIPTHMAISLSKFALQIVDTATGAVRQTFSVGVGKPGTGTPLGLTYIEARYVDPAQAAGRHPINLTSAHSAVEDHPFGSDQGLVGIHFEEHHTGAISHGCTRLSEPASVAVAQLPIGTPVLITQ